MKTGIVTFRQLGITGRMDAAYNLAVREYLEAHHLDDSEAHVREAMQALKDEDVAKVQKAHALRLKAKELEEEARLVEQSRLKVR